MSQSLSLEEIQEITRQAILAGQISADAQTWELATLATLFGLSVEEAETEMNEFFEHMAEVACYGPVHSIQ